MQKRAPKSSHPEASNLNHASYVAGCEYFNAGKFRKALTAFREAVNYWPEDPQAWMAIGNCYDELNRPKQAEKAFRAALEFADSADSESITYNLGNSLFDQARYEEAIAAYSSLNPGSEVWRKGQLNIKRAEAKV